MKKVLSAIIAVAIVVSFAGCAGKEQAAQLSLNEFIDTYKRASLEDFIENPKDLINDLPKLMYSKKDEDALDGWERGENRLSDAFESYSLDGVILDLPATINAYFAKDELYSFSFVLNMETSQDDFNCAVSLCEYMFDEYGDAYKIEIDGEESSEYDLKQLFSKNKCADFDVKWQSGKDDDIKIGIRCYYLSDINSFVDISVRGDMLHPFSEEEAVTALLPQN